MIINDSIKYRKGRAPNIINADDDSYVIVGSRSHGHRISEDSIDKLVNSLKNVVALKMEGDERMYEELHPLSTEVVVKTSVGSVPTSYFPESDKEDLGKKLLKYNVPEEMVEIYIPLAHIRLNDGVLYNPDGIPLLLLMNKKRFFFIDPVRAEINFSNICNYWADNKLNKKDLLHFSFDFEKFLGDIREYEFWMPDLKKFRKDYQGKIAVCSGDYHTFFVKKILDGKEPQKPDWVNHIDKRRENLNTPQDAEKLKSIYRNLEEALNP
ncbi:hypothetical protein COY26_04745 [Candidatus Woesearchaeota archaeon CG_4_10_14_0_2_um_filter_33_10]|nr:MAG: hypothetical protein AUJ83_04820 [Candidatus Woesearchaeota archaeon CG1_02_33_12]PIN78578.1 MAG: hypothetical protein COV14_02950 [Candidatus Woesearchaeota archaeon CG10_big_fil_rev_8_21_14_0_10_33_12]PIU72814.1 MAG: hypothetical protein COS79_00970 [Candidatus Woesearchaeota archaeon CG06_land_8_20_14_3_00_33_13]PIZ52365.1 MAG: hypothetical protein COY26_04745 [Candidatus Woesearchaeota archaeon CG_4_10_14_0_2_um_filter_33_10]